MNAQDKILGMVGAEIERWGFSTIKRMNYANTGALSVERDGEFGELGGVLFDFQTSSFTLVLYKADKNGRTERLLYDPMRVDYYDHYLSYGDKVGFEYFKRRLGSLMRSVGGIEPDGKESKKKATTKKGGSRGKKA